MNVNLLQPGTRIRVVSAWGVNPDGSRATFVRKLNSTEALVQFADEPQPMPVLIHTLRRDS